MKAKFRKYAGVEDFLRVRDFLAETFRAFAEPTNWGIERWNWARYHPMVFCEKDPALTASHIAFWEGTVGLWEDGAGRLVGVVNPEMPEPAAEAYLQRAPEADGLLPEMLEYAESTLADPGSGRLQVSTVFDHDEALRSLLRAHGYEPDPEPADCRAEYDMAAIPEPRLPAGYAILAMSEGGDRAERCRVQGLGFNHPDPAVWMTVAEYAEVRKAPDYREDLDLAVRAPSGEYAACCILWHDARNKVCFFEPVCTRPEYRRLGLGRELLYEAMRRGRELGAARAYVGSRQEFYRSIGFRMRLFSRGWSRPGGGA